MRQLVYTSLLLIITLGFAYGERKICSTIKKSQNIMNMIVCKNSFLFFMSLLTALISKNSHTLTAVYFTVLRKTSQTKLEKLSISNLDLNLKIGKLVISSMKNSSIFLQISCSNFGLKLCQRRYSYKNCQTNKV